MEFNDMINKVICGDCLEVMKGIPDNSIDCIITDPPYNINYKSNHGSKEYKERIQTAEKWDNNFNFTLYFHELWRILKNDSYMYVFGRRENISIMEKLGYNQMLIWNKQHCGMGNLNTWGVGYELIFVFEKGQPKLNGHRHNSVIDMKHIGFFDNTVHPTQKPVSIISYLIEKSTKPNDLILDAFLGSGTTAVACAKLQRRFIGIEISPEYCKIAENRIKQFDDKQVRFEF
jgi:site-specific DNA-methyltransferase (adenine-specific)